MLKCSARPISRAEKKRIEIIYFRLIFSLHTSRSEFSTLFQVLNSFNFRKILDPELNYYIL